MEYFRSLSSLEWELINVNSQLIIAKIEEVENVKRMERHEKELRELAHFQVMELKMALEEKEIESTERVREEAEQSRERLELVEFEMLERKFEEEEKLEQTIREERERKEQVQKMNVVVKNESISCAEHSTMLVSNNNIKPLVEKVRFASPSTGKLKPESIATKKVITRCNFKPSLIPKLFFSKATRQRQNI